MISDVAELISTGVTCQKLKTTWKTAMVNELWQQWRDSIPFMKLVLIQYHGMWMKMDISSWLSSFAILLN